MEIAGMMHIGRPTYKTNFKSAWKKIAFDSSAEDPLNYLLDRHYANMYPYRTGHLINCAKMENVPLKRIERIARGIYKGESPKWHPDGVSALKQAGIERIVDIAGYDQVKRACDFNNVEYYCYLIEEEEALDKNLFFNRTFFKSTEDVLKENTYLYEKKLGYKGKQLKEALEKSLQNYQKEKSVYIEQFVNLIRTLQKRNVYVCCEYGTTRTDMVLLLNYLFNPDIIPESADKLDFDKEFLDKAIVLYKNLTSEDKLKLGWLKGGDKHFMLKFNKLMERFVKK